MVSPFWYLFRLKISYTKSKRQLCLPDTVGVTDSQKHLNSQNCSQRPWKKVDSTCKNTRLAKCAFPLKIPLASSAISKHYIQQTNSSQCTGLTICANWHTQTQCTCPRCSPPQELPASARTSGIPDTKVSLIVKNLSWNLISQSRSVSGQLKLRAW